MLVTILIVSSKHLAFGLFCADMNRHKQTYKSGICGRLGFCSRLRQGGDNASENSEDGEESHLDLRVRFRRKFEVSRSKSKPQASHDTLFIALHPPPSSSITKLLQHLLTYTPSTSTRSTTPAPRYNLRKRNRYTNAGFRPLTHWRVYSSLCA